MKQYDYIIGIDPGTHTGMAKWKIADQRLDGVKTVQIHFALTLIAMENRVANIFVRVEDARLRKWFGNDKGDRAKSQGVGSIKRDCVIWEDFLKDMGIDYEMVAPKAVKTKLTAESFKSLTGWEGKTTEHSRDAGMMVYQWNNK